MSQRWVSTLENNRLSHPRIWHLHALADALNLDLAELVIAAKLAQSRAEAARVIDGVPDDGEPFLNLLMREGRDLTEEGQAFVLEQMRIARRIYGERPDQSKEDQHETRRPGPNDPTDSGQ